MQIETNVTIKVTITLAAEDARYCALTCAYRRSSRCALYRKDLVVGRRVAECVRDTPVPTCPDKPEFAHVRDPRAFNLKQLEDIVAQAHLDDSATRADLAKKWQHQDQIKPRTSFAASDADVYGYGPTDRNGFFPYPAQSP